MDRITSLLRHKGFTGLLLVFGVAVVILFVKLKAPLPPLPPAENFKTIIESNAGCTTPCWRGLVPGESTEDMFLNLVDVAPAGGSESLGKVFPELRRPVKEP